MTYRDAEWVDSLSVHHNHPPASAFHIRMDSSPAVLKERAAALELRKHPEQALRLYHQLLDEYGGTEHVDVTVRNRVGDLHLRLKQIDEAVTLFEVSADEYANSGFLSNAIALCNKILRYRPDHVSTLRRLARFSAEKGMVVDAQRHYLLVADALEARGQHTEALQALEEFARLSPDDPHVRSVVVAHLLGIDRPMEALPHLTVLHRLHLAAGRHLDAAAVVEAALDIDECWTPDSDALPDRKLADLPFLVLDGDFESELLEMPDGSARGLLSQNRREQPDRRRGDRRKMPRRDTMQDVGLDGVIL